MFRPVSEMHVACSLLDCCFVLPKGLQPSWERAIKKLIKTYAAVDLQVYYSCGAELSLPFNSGCFLGNLNLDYFYFRTLPTMPSNG